MWVDPLDQDHGGTDLANGGDNGNEPAAPDFDTAIAEWDRANPIDAPGGAQRPQQGEQDRRGRETPATENAGPDLSSGLDYGPVREALKQRAAEVERERGRQDFSRLVDKLEQHPDFAAMGRTFLETWLVGAAQADDRIALAWAHRYENPNAWAQRYRKMVANLAETLRKRPDEEATETRAAVAAAVRRGSNAVPESKPKDWANMTTKQLNEARAEFGLSPMRDW